MFRALVFGAGGALLAGLLLSSTLVLLAGILLALFAVLEQADRQHQELLAQLRGDEVPARPDPEKKWRDYLREQGHTQKQG